MKFEDVRVRDVFRDLRRNKDERFIITKIGIQPFSNHHFIWNDGSVGFSSDIYWNAGRVRLISRNKTVTVSVSNE